MEEAHYMKMHTLSGPCCIVQIGLPLDGFDCQAQYMRRIERICTSQFHGVKHCIGKY
jgi:hypothetical protein